MPIVTRTIPVDLSNNPGDSTYNTYVDLAMLLSEYYGKNIRQGQNFKLGGIQATLHPSEDLDIGMNASVKHTYIPTVKHSRKAWNMLFSQWKAQKLLAGKVGQHMRYDDFELGWDASSAYHSATRTSTMFSSGIGDTTSEKLMLTGSSTAGTDHTLLDYYNSQHRARSESIDPFTGAVIKAAKFNTTSPFPAEQVLWSTSTASSMVDSNATPDMLGGAIANDSYTPFPSPANVMCGVMKLNVYVMPDDTGSQIEDAMSLTISYHILSFKPLEIVTGKH